MMLSFENTEIECTNNWLVGCTFDAEKRGDKWVVSTTIIGERFSNPSDIAEESEFIGCFESSFFELSKDEQESITFFLEQNADDDWNMSGWSGVPF